jgi:hypothetical protein
MVDADPLHISEYNGVLRQLALGYSDMVLSVNQESFVRIVQQRRK